MFAVIYIRDFSLQSALRHEPELIPEAVVLTDPALTKPCVIQLTQAARLSGIYEGMTPSQAMARCGNLVVKTRSLPQEQAAMEALMQSAYAFSPNIEATAPGVCTIELKGLGIEPVGRASSRADGNAEPPMPQRLAVLPARGKTLAPPAIEPFRQWANEILRVLKQFHLDGRIGFAETPELALLAARAARPILIAQRGRARLEDPTPNQCLFSTLQSQRDCALQPRVAKMASPARTELPWVEGRTSPNPERVQPLTLNASSQRPAQNEKDFISELPIEALDLPFESLEILKRWGINIAGAFLALGKDQLAERLGPAIVDVFDRLSTQSVRPLKIASPPETFEEEIEFENEIETLEPLLFILRRFIEQLSRRIELLYLVVAELHLKLGLTSGATYERAFTIPSPTGSAETLFRVLHTHLETLRTDAPIASLRLAAKPGRPESHQFGLFETTLRNPNQFAETLARLASLCGSDRIGTPVVEATYRPDAFHMKPADFRTSLERERTTSQRVRIQHECGRQTPRGLPLRRFRPALLARVEFRARRPVLMRSAVFSGVIADIRGPFLSSGNWWENNRWWREEWDVQTSNGDLYRIFRRATEVDDQDSSPESDSPMPLSLETDQSAQYFQSSHPGPVLLQFFVEGIYD